MRFSLCGETLRCLCPMFNEQFELAVPTALRVEKPKTHPRESMNIACGKGALSSYN